MKSTNERDNIVKWRDDEMKIRIEADVLSGTAAEQARFIFDRLSKIGALTILEG